MSVKKRPEDRKVTIKIPGTLYNRITEIVSGSGFNSVTEFVVYVLRDLVSTQGEHRESQSADKEHLSKEEIAAIRRRLRSLGYL